MVYQKESSLRTILLSPIYILLLYPLIVPLIFLDISVEIYHRLAFRLYGVDYVPRSKYIVIDRHHLSKLNLWQKINCVYCGYANGLLAYVTKIAACTEKYWCGIKHRQSQGRFVPEHHADFVDYEEFE